MYRGLFCRDTNTGVLCGTNLERSAACVELLTHDADVCRSLLSVYRALLSANRTLLNVYRTPFTWIAAQSVLSCSRMMLSLFAPCKKTMYLWYFPKKSYALYLCIQGSLVCTIYIHIYIYIYICKHTLHIINEPGVQRRECQAAHI